MSHTLPPLIITSMNERLYLEYGHRFFDTFDRRLELIVYHEDYSDSAGDKPPYIPEWAGHIHTPTVVPELYRWTTAHKDRPTNSYKTDAVRFSHKVWAMWHAVMAYSGWTEAYSGIIWMDADTTFKRMPTPKELVNYLDRADITLYDRPEHPETGCIWFSTRHKEINAWNSTYECTARHFVNRLRLWYESDRIYELPEQHDAYVTGHILRTEFQGKWASLSETDRAPGRHPQAVSKSARWWDHAKGPRKMQGRSPENTV
jgi:hypothetical protein